MSGSHVRDLRLQAVGGLTEFRVEDSFGSGGLVAIRYQFTGTTWASIQPSGKPVSIEGITL
jgi:hypothetical protein